MLALLFIIAFACWLIYKWRLDEMFVEWTIFWVIEIALYIVHNWFQILMLLAWIALWVFIALNNDAIRRY